MGGGLKNTVSKRGVMKSFSFQSRVLKLFVLQSPKNPGERGGGLNLDQISFYCTSIQILM